MTASNDNTAFQAAAEVNSDDVYRTALPLKGASNENMVAQLMLKLPDAISAKVYTEVKTWKKCYN